MQVSSSLLNRLFIAFCFFVFILFVFYRVIFIYYPHPSAAGVDNNVVYFVQRLLNGETLYTDPAKSPYAVAQYGPLYYYLVAFAAKFVHSGPDNVLELFMISKLLCLLLNFILAGIAFLTARKIFDLSPLRSLFVSFLVFIFIEGNSFARPDSLEHLFFLLSFYFLAGAIKKRENGLAANGWLITSAVIAVLAIFSKQSAITLPVLAGFWFIAKPERRKSLLVYATAFIISMALLLLVFEKLTGVHNMLLNIVMGLDNGIYWGSYWVDIIVNFYSWYGCLWVISFLFLYFLLRKEKAALFRFFAFALLIQFLLTNLFALKFGATSNYFTDWWTLLFFAMALYWDRLASFAKRVQPNLDVAFLSILLVLKMALVLQPAIDKIRTRDQRMAFYETERALADHVVSMSSGRTLVFCNLFSVDSYLNNFLFREAIVPQYDIVSLASYPKKVYDYTALRNDLSNGAVRYIITNDDRTHFMDIELNKYRFFEKHGRYTIYKYSDRDSTTNK